LISTQSSNGADIARRCGRDDLRAVVYSSTQPRAAFPQLRGNSVVPVPQGII